MDVDKAEWRVYVNWLVTNLSRKAPIKGVMDVSGVQLIDAWKHNLTQKDRRPPPFFLSELRLSIV